MTARTKIINNNSTLDETKGHANEQISTPLLVEGAVAVAPETIQPSNDNYNTPEATRERVGRVEVNREASNDGPGFDYSEFRDHYYVTPQKPRPFVKWAGGKRQLLGVLRPMAQTYYFKNYIEPFVGGGALLFDRLPNNGIISDINPELINTYIIIRDDVEKLIESLGEHVNDEAYYYQVRAQDPAEMSYVQRASRTLYLNHTCFNGLYRVNRAGQFNTPFGRYTNPNIADAENLRAVSGYLNDSNIKIAHQDYRITVAKAANDDFVYLDPPYSPLSSTSNFTGYARGGFTEQDQEELEDVCRSLAKRGCYVMLTNSNTPFIKELYKDFYIVEIAATRNINCRGDRRGKANVELLITSYELNNDCTGEEE